MPELKLIGPSWGPMIKALTALVTAAADAAAAYAKETLLRHDIYRDEEIHLLQKEVLRQELKDKRSQLERKKARLEGEVRELERRKNQARQAVVKSHAGQGQPNLKNGSKPVQQARATSQRQQPLTHKPFEGLAVEVAENAEPMQASAPANE